MRIQNCWAIILFLGLSCCTLFTANLKKPNVTIQDVRFQEPTAEGGTLLFLLLVENTNEKGLSIDGLRYNVQLNNKEFTHGQLEQGIQLPANQKTLVQIPTKVRYHDILESALAFLSSKAIRFHIDGTIKTGWWSI